MFPEGGRFAGDESRAMGYGSNRYPVRRNNSGKGVAENQNSRRDPTAHASEATGQGFPLYKERGKRQAFVGLGEKDLWNAGAVLRPFFCGQLLSIAFH